MKVISIIFFFILITPNLSSQTKKGNWAIEAGSFFSSAKTIKEKGNGILPKTTAIGIKFGVGYHFKINEQIALGLGLNTLIYPFVYDLELLTLDYPSLRFNYYHRLLEHNLAYEIPLTIQYKLRISNRLDIVPNLGVAFRGFILPTSTYSVKSSSQSNNNTDAKLFFIKNEYKSGLNTGLSSSLSLNYSFSNLSTLGFKIDFGYSFTDLAIGQYTILESEEDESSGKQITSGSYLGSTLIYNFSTFKRKK